MPRLALVFAIGLSILSSGCFSGVGSRSRSMLDRFPLGGPSGPDAVMLEYALVERPFGNAAVNREVWKEIDEQLLSSDRRTLLNQNGIRVGSVGGMLPSQMQALVSNPKLLEERRVRGFYSGTPWSYSLNGPFAQAEFTVQTTPNKPATSQKFEQARFALNITPTIQPTGGITLTCTPEVEYHDPAHWTPLGAVGQGWLTEKPKQKYDDLAFEVTMGENDYLVLGTWHDRRGTLGHYSFVGNRGQDPVQRLLIVRAYRPPTDSVPGLSSSRDNSGVVPLVGQVRRPIIRGKRPE